MVKYRMLHHGQTEVMDSRARFKVIACGRRWGKTELGKTALLHRDAAGWETGLVAGAHEHDGEPGLA